MMWFAYVSPEFTKFMNFMSADGYWRLLHFLNTGHWLAR
jgi:hypothetical protein